MKDKNGNIIKSVFESMTLDEISAVDNPAQPGALATIMKREPTKEEMEASMEAEDEGVKPGKGKKKKKKVEKRAALTTVVEGHTHLIADESYLSDLVAGTTEYAEMDQGDEHPAHHSHPWVKTDDGRIVIGEVLGHTHEVDPSAIAKVFNGTPDSDDASNSNSGDSADPVGNVQIEDSMPTNKNEKTVDQEAVAKQLEEMKKSNERLQQIAELSDAQKGIFKSLEGEKADAFLSLTPEQREAEVAKATEADAVVYKSQDGEEFRKSDDPRMVAMAKRADEERDLRKAAEAKSQESDLRKRAEDLQHIPGDVNVRMNMLKAIDGLPEEQRTPALEALKAQDAQLGTAFERAGTSEVPSTDDPLKAIAKKISDADSSLTPEQAMSKALSTPEGEAAYAKSRGF